MSHQIFLNKTSQKKLYNYKSSLNYKVNDLNNEKNDYINICWLEKENFYSLYRDHYKL